MVKPDEFLEFADLPGRCPSAAIAASVDGRSHPVYGQGLRYAVVLRAASGRATRQGHAAARDLARGSGRGKQPYAERINDSPGTGRSARLESLHSHRTASRLSLRCGSDSAAGFHSATRHLRGVERPICLPPDGVRDLHDCAAPSLLQPSSRWWRLRHFFSYHCHLNDPHRVRYKRSRCCLSNHSFRRDATTPSSWA